MEADLEADLEDDLEDDLDLDLDLVEVSSSDEDSSVDLVFVEVAVLVEVILSKPMQVDDMDWVKDCEGISQILQSQLDSCLDLTYRKSGVRNRVTLVALLSNVRTELNSSIRLHFDRIVVILGRVRASFTRGYMLSAEATIHQVLSVHSHASAVKSTARKGLR